MKKIALSVAALAISTGSALAADLPSRKAAPVLPPPPPPAPMWTGFYVGLNAGGTWADSNRQTIGVGPVAFTPGFPAGNADQLTAHLTAFSSAASASGANSSNGGFIGGGQIGYNWQFYGSLVAGIEADIQGLAGNSGAASVATAASVGDGSSYVGIHSVRGNLDYIGTVRGRLGWLFTPTLLLYGTGGLAYGGVTLNTASFVANDALAGAGVLPASIGGANFSNTQVGWTAGGGVEWMFMPNWSAKVEYLYYDLGSVAQNYALASTNAAGTQSALFGGQVRARVNGNMVRAGLNYHFNWGAPAPVIAKY
jgi:outer membrane immunogenic protein